MPWDNSVNKKAHIHAVVTTLGVRNMPLTDCVRTPGSISLSRQAGIYVIVHSFSTATISSPSISPVSSKPNEAYNFLAISFSGS